MAANATRTQKAELAALREQVEQMSAQLNEATTMIREIRGLVGPFAANMPNDRLLVQTIHGLKYLIDPRDLIMAPQLIVYRQWEAELSALFRRLLTPDSVVVDVGANFGYFTCLSGALIGSGGRGRVYAVEPNPHLIELLRANIAINWSMCPIEVFPVAAGASAGMATLSIPLDRAANASLSGLMGDNIRTVETPLCPLDDIVPAGTQVHLLKIDVEGHEAGVFEGARRVIADSPDINIIIEWSQPQMHEAGGSAQAMLALFKDLDLAVQAVPEDGSEVTPLEYADLPSIEYTNILLTRRGA